MTGPEVLDVARDGVMTFLKVGLPVMLVGLVVGLAVSLVQALTQVQEQTLVAVPKIVSVSLGLVVLMPFMADAMGAYMARIAAIIVAGG